MEKNDPVIFDLMGTFELDCEEKRLCASLKIQVQSNLLMRSPLLRDHLSNAASFSGFHEPKYSANEPVKSSRFLSFPWTTL